METLYFTLGIASVVVAAVAVVAVRAVIMVEKLNSRYKQQFTNTHRDITMVEQTIMNQLDAFIQSCDQRFDKTNIESKHNLLELRHRIDERCDHIERMVDSRVDKLHHQMKESLPSNKQLLKG